VIEEEIEIRTPDGVPGGYLYRAEEDRPRPGVILLTDIGGIRDTFRDMARRLAEEGYTVLMPNAFYRTGKPPLFDFPPRAADERTMKRFDELRAPLTPKAVERDADAYVEFLAGHRSVSGGVMGVVGYCFTGALALRTAAVRPEKIAAAASFHGGSLFTDTPASPHLVLPRVKARLYFGHATNDRSMPAEAIASLEQALQAWGGHYESEIYEGAHHGWTVANSPAYNPPQAERAFHKLKALFAATLQ